MDRNKWNSILYLIAGVLFLIAGTINKNYIFISIGCCFFDLGITNRNMIKNSFN